MYEILGPGDTGEAVNTLYSSATTLKPPTGEVNNADCLITVAPVGGRGLSRGLNSEGAELLPNSRSGGMRLLVCSD